MNPNSLAIYFDRIRQQVGERQLVVMRQLSMENPRSCEMVADRLGVPVHTISGRFTELKNLGLIRVAGRRKNHAGNTCDEYLLTGEEQPNERPPSKDETIRDLRLKVRDLTARLEKYEPETEGLGSPPCSCRLCNPNAWWMVVCSQCGNKRCPHATDHRHECTNSNEPDQEGSIYCTNAGGEASQPEADRRQHKTL